MNRVSLEPKAPSIYGRLRAEPKRTYVSTLESVAGALTLCGEDPEVQATLERIFRTLVQCGTRSSSRRRAADRRGARAPSPPRERHCLPRRTTPRSTNA